MADIIKAKVPRTLEATITVTLKVQFDEPGEGVSWGEAAGAAMLEALYHDHEGVISPVNHTVDSIVVVEEGR